MQETLPRRFAPEIFRKRMLIEGYFGRPALDAEAIREYFRVMTRASASAPTVSRSSIRPAGRATPATRVTTPSSP